MSLNLLWPAIKDLLVGLKNRIQFSLVQLPQKYGTQPAQPVLLVHPCPQYNTCCNYYLKMNYWQ